MVRNNRHWSQQIGSRLNPFVAKCSQDTYPKTPTGTKAVTQRDWSKLDMLERDWLKRESCDHRQFGFRMQPITCCEFVAQIVLLIIYIETVNVLHISFHSVSGIVLRWFRSLHTNERKPCNPSMFVIFCFRFLKASESLEKSN